jgi:glycosyltransferase involved in cell wall biosynthesis
MALYIQLIFKIESKFSLGYGAARLFSKCSHHIVDLYIMHQELPTVVGCELLRDGYKVAFDFEDWYSRDLSVEAQKMRPLNLLRDSENYALNNGTKCWTTSIAMSQELKNTYKLSMTPSVIYNSFNSIYEIQKRYLNNPIKLYWISQTIGPGRGLEFFIESMAKSKYSYSLTLRGGISEDFKRILCNKLNPKDSLCILDQIPFNDILLDLENYDFGVVTELKYPANRNLTIANKLFYYLSAGLPVIASDTLGHKEILSENEFLGFLFEDTVLTSLTDILNKIGSSKSDSDFVSRRRDILLYYRDNYCWDLEIKKLLLLIDNTLKI